MAAAFDEDMMEQVGNAVGVEARGKYNMCRAHGDRDIFKGLTVWAPTSTSSAIPAGAVATKLTARIRS